MTAFKLPPPPNSSKIDSPEWKQWFFLLNKFASSLDSGLVTIDRLSPDVLAFAASHG